MLSRVSRGTFVLVLLFGLHLLLSAVVLGYVAHAAPVGDENHYLDAGRALSNLVRDLASAGPVHGEELRRNVVGNGWFMPGTGIVLAPLYLVDPDASLTAARVWIGVVSNALLVAAAVSTRRTLGPVHAGALLVFRRWCRCGWCSRSPAGATCSPGSCWCRC